jgi:hypothetical protein
MKTILCVLLAIATSQIYAQQIEIPKGIVYKYCDSATFEKAKSEIALELGAAPTYSIFTGLLFTGPVLWTRLGKLPELNAIKGGNITITGWDKTKPSAKMLQNNDDFKLVWNHLRTEIGNNPYKMRKATPAELKYYWAVISFDIEEPLIIVETASHNYIMNLSAKDFKLVWLDEAPRS